MTARSAFLRRLAAGIVLLGTLGGAGLHHHENLAGTVGAPAERALSSHDPLSRGSHWHAAVVAKDDLCLACHGQRAVGLSVEGHGAAPVASVRFRGAGGPALPAVAALSTHGSRAPPALL